MAAARDKMDAENFTAQLKRNLAIIEYNKTLGKNLPLFPSREGGEVSKQQAVQTTTLMLKIIEVRVARATHR